MSSASEGDEDGPSSAAGKKHRCADVDALVDVLEIEAIDRGKDMVKYPINNEKCMQKVECNKKKIFRHKRLLRALKHVQANMSFRKKSLVRALKLVAKHHHGKWKVDPATWSVEKDFQLRAMCFLVAKADRKKPRVKWISKLLYHNADDDDDDLNDDDYDDGADDYEER